MIPTTLILGFVKRWWKAILIGALVTGTLVWHQHIVKKRYDAAFTDGKEAAAKEVSDAFQIALTARENRIRALEGQVKDYEVKLAAADKARQAKEKPIVERIETLIPKQPDCQIDPEIITLINRLRSIK